METHTHKKHANFSERPFLMETQKYGPEMPVLDEKLKKKHANFSQRPLLMETHKKMPISVRGPIFYGHTQKTTALRGPIFDGNTKKKIGNPNRN